MGTSRFAVETASRVKRRKTSLKSARIDGELRRRKSDKKSKESVANRARRKRRRHTA